MKTMYEAIGGPDRIRAVLQSLYDRLFEDPIVGFLFEGKDKAHLVEQLAFTCKFLGGPEKYTGRPLPEVHAALPLLAGHFDRRHFRLLQQVLEAGTACLSGSAPGVARHRFEPAVERPVGGEGGAGGDRDAARRGGGEA